MTDKRHNDIDIKKSIEILHAMPLEQRKLVALVWLRDDMSLEDAIARVKGGDVGGSLGDDDER